MSLYAIVIYYNKRGLNMKRILTLALLAGIFLTACAPGNVAEGTLQFRANGEDFVRQGFVSKDGWAIAFDHVYVHLSGIAGYQTDPPYDAHAGGAIQGTAGVSLDETFTVDLAEGDADAEPLLVAEVAGVPAGHYNALAFSLTPAEAGPAAPYALVIMGSAEKDGESVAFTLNIEESYTFTCGEYVGDARKGFVEADGTSELEMTFHFDHIFGDIDSPMDDSLNMGAVGFEPFAALAEDGALVMDMAALAGTLDAETYTLLVETLPTLGHVGEGHCHESLMD